jgi:ribosomal protein S18 acetylase RimI-like enzyme
MLIPEIDFCTTQDLQALVFMEKHCFPESPWSFRILLRDLEESSREALFYLGAFWKGFLVGYGVFRPRGENLALLRIGVHRRYRRQRIGSQLLEAGEVLAGEIPLSGITLEVRQENREARRFYESFGYFQEGVSQKPSGDSQNPPLVYRKDLAKPLERSK